MKKAYSEVYTIFELLPNELISKIPIKLRDFIIAEKDENYIANINPNIPLENQKLLTETITILALLKLNYWCENEEEKYELMKMFQDNEYQYELEKKYNLNNIFDNKYENVQLPVPIKKDSFKNKIIKFIYKILGKNFDDGLH